MELIRVGNVDIEVSFKEIRNVHLSVHPPDGKVTVSAPQHIALDKIRVYAATKLPWIKKEQKKITAQEREPQKEYITQESHFFLGERYLLKVDGAKHIKVRLKHSKIELLAPESATAPEKRKILYSWYRRELRKQLDRYVDQYCKFMHLTKPAYGIRQMKTKWGSCVTGNQHLWFNIELAKKPLDCIEYIVVHELVHLIERHHNKNFILLMDRYLPGWRVQKKILNELPI